MSVVTLHPTGQGGQKVGGKQRSAVQRCDLWLAAPLGATLTDSTDKGMRVREETERWMGD